MTPPVTDNAELVREALELAQVWAPSEWDNADTCLVRDAKEAFDRLTARLDAERWQPIETAPHATDVLLWTPEGMEVGQASWGWRTAAVSNMSYHGRATHWRPLPTPPETDNG